MFFVCRQWHGVCIAHSRHRNRIEAGHFVVVGVRAAEIAIKKGLVKKQRGSDFDSGERFFFFGDSASKMVSGRFATPIALVCGGSRVSCEVSLRLTQSACYSAGGDLTSALRALFLCALSIGQRWGYPQNRHSTINNNH